MSRRLAIVLNPDSGKDETSQTDIKKLFKDYDILLEFFDIKKGIDSLSVAIARYKPSAVIAVGGDGTVNAVATIAVQLDLPMSVIPSGTLNHFAKDAGISLDPGSAVKSIVRGNVTRIDYGSINGRVFVNNCNLGGYPETVLKRDQITAINNKWLTGAIAAVQTFRQHRKQVFTLVTDGTSRTVRAGSLFVGNNRYQLEGVNFTTRTTVDQGELQLVIIKTGRLRHVIRIVIGFIFRGSHDKAETHTVKKIEINSGRTSYNVAIDGEVVRLTMPLAISIHPKALQVLI